MSSSSTIVVTVNFITSSKFNNKIQKLTKYERTYLRLPNYVDWQKSDIFEIEQVCFYSEYNKTASTLILKNL